MVEPTDVAPGWEQIPPALAAVARRSGISAAELLAFRDDPANQGVGVPDLDDHDWELITAPSDDSRARMITTAVSRPDGRVPPPAVETIDEPDADDQRCVRSRLATLRGRGAVDGDPERALPPGPVDPGRTIGLSEGTASSPDGLSAERPTAEDFPTDVADADGADADGADADGADADAPQVGAPRVGVREVGALPAGGVRVGLRPVGRRAAYAASGWSSARPSPDRRVLPPWRALRMRLGDLSVRAHRGPTAPDDHDRHPLAAAPSLATRGRDHPVGLAGAPARAPPGCSLRQHRASTVVRSTPEALRPET